MMMRKYQFKYHLLRAWVTTLLVLLFHVFSWGQEKEIEFTAIRGTDDINLGKINAITQDKNGFIWLSAQNNRSIVRYDGNNMEQIFSNPDDLNDPKALGGFYPECFFADESGYLWIGFYGQGLDRYDMNTNTFKHFDHDPDDPTSLASDYVTAVHRDNAGNLWVGTYNGLDLLNEETGTFIHHNYEPNNINSLSGDSIRVIYEDKSGTLWIGTGLGWLPNSRGGLNRYNRDQNNFTRYIHDPNNPTSLINNYVRAILEDHWGNFWVGTFGDGLHLMNRETGIFTRLTYDPKNPNKLSRPPVISSSDRITFIKEDKEGKIWIGTDQNGINLYDPDKKTITHYSDEVDNAVWWMFISNDDQIWITTNGNNLLKVNLDHTLIPAYYGQIRRKYIESDSVRWFGTDNGLVRELQKEANSEMTFYSLLPDNQKRIKPKWNSFTEEPIATDAPTVLNKDDKGRILFRSNLNPKLYLLDPISGKVTENNVEDTLQLDRMDLSQILVQDTFKWIGSWGNGLLKINLKNNAVSRYINDPTDGRSLCDNVILYMNTDIEGNIWFATPSGIQRYNPITDDFSNFLLGTLSFQLFRDSKGILWAATVSGVYYYDSSVKKFEATKIKENTFSIFEDPSDKSLWFGTGLGVYKLDSSRNYTSFYDLKVQNKAPEEDNRDWSIFEGYRKNGKIFLGASDSRSRNFYYVFDPEKLTETQFSSSPYFANLWLNEKLIEPGPNSVIQSKLDQLKTLKLANDQNIFSVSFASINFQDHFDNDIYFKLEGFDLDWRITEPNERIGYFKIPTGEYKLRIKTPNPDGSWNENTLEIIVAPPFYLTIWAYIAYFMVLCASVLIVHRFQKARVLRKERERNRDRELDQAREIEKAYTELKATQNQLIQAEKMASLGELTAGIAHEIQNPLNFVNNFSEVSTELLVEMNEEIDAGNYNEVKAITQDVMQNLEKILHHGKRADGIVKSMLHHSRGNTGEKELTDINVLADEYLRLSFHGLRAKDKSFNADFKLETDDKLPKIRVVPQDIGRVLLNLINNAFYTVKEKSEGKEEGYKPTVTVTTKLITTSQNKQKIQIRVLDNGNGIPEELKGKIFQPFFTTKPTGQGTGLGLSLSYDIIKAHGGMIDIESIRGEKTEFIIELPVNP